jgi:cytoskeleton protein RodZ
MQNLEKFKKTMGQSVLTSVENKNETTSLSLKEIGKILTLAREKMGKSMEDAVDETKIRRDFLTSIESGAVENLPGKVYAIGFMRTYANYLGLDENALIASLKASTDFHAVEDKNFHRMTDSSQDFSGDQRGRPSIIMLLGVGLAAIGVYLYFSNDTQLVSQSDQERVHVTNTMTTPPANTASTTEPVTQTTESATSTSSATDNISTSTATLPTSLTDLDKTLPTSQETTTSQVTAKAPSSATETTVTP